MKEYRFPPMPLLLLIVFGGLATGMGPCPSNSTPPPQKQGVDDSGDVLVASGNSEAITGIRNLRIPGMPGTYDVQFVWKEFMYYWGRPGDDPTTWQHDKPLFWSDTPDQHARQAAETAAGAIVRALFLTVEMSTR